MCIDHWEKRGDGQVPMRRTSKCSTFQNPERGLFSLPRPSHSLLSTSHHSSQESIYTPTIPQIFFLVPPLHPTEPPLFLRFLFFLFSPCRWETETIVALRHCVPRRRPSASNPLSPRLTANTIPSYMLAASLLSPVLPVVSVVLPLASWPGEHLSVIHYLHLPFHLTLLFLYAFPLDLAFCLSTIPGRRRCMHVMRCAPRGHMGCRALVCGRLSLPTLSWVSPSISTVPHPRSVWC